MIGINDGILQYFLIYLCVIFFNPNCRVLCNGAKELKKSTIKFCDVPTLLPHSNITYQCTRYIKNQSKSCVYNGTVFESTSIKISCDAGYSTDAMVSVCKGNEWVPPITGCSKKCKKLNPVNVNLECFRKNISIPCDEKYLVSGVTVRPTCDHLNSSRFQSYPGHHEIHCQEDGNWDNDLLSCVQDCGRLEKNSNDLKTFSMPWDVIIYGGTSRTGANCFGTIISPRVILTSEYCMLNNVWYENHYRSMSRDPLDPAVFEVEMLYYYPVHRMPLWEKLFKLYTSLRIKEFRLFKHGKRRDKSLFHDALIVIMEKEISFNSRVHPVCVQWENPERLNSTTGVAKVQQWNGGKEGYSYEDYSFLSHEACQENPEYPYFVFNWATSLYNFDKANIDLNDTKTFRLDSTKSNQTALHEGKLFCIKQKQDQLNDYMTVKGSGVMIEKDDRYFIRGIAGEIFPTHESKHDTGFKNFMNEIRYIANKSYEDFSKNISDAIINGLFYPQFIDHVVYFSNYNFPSLLRNYLESTARSDKLLNRTDKLIGVTDIADYVDWIKHVVAEVDPYYI